MASSLAMQDSSGADKCRTTHRPFGAGDAKGRVIREGFKRRWHLGWSECKCDPSVLLALGGPFCPDDPNLYRVQEPAGTGTVFVLHSVLFIWLLQGSFHPELQSRRETARGSSPSQASTDTTREGLFGGPS